MTCRTEDGVTYKQEYNSENRISSIMKLAEGSCENVVKLATKWDFAYDGDGARVATLTTPYDGNGDPQTASWTAYYFGGAYEVRSDSTTIKYYSFAGQMVAMHDGNGLQYFLSDHLGSVVATTDSTGTLTSQQRYLPFGGVRPNVPSPDAPATDFGYTGQRNLDSGIGLMDYKARFYSPYINRFVQPDTLIPGMFNPQNLNRFSYVRNNPIRYTDPSGHAICMDDGYCGKPSDTAYKNKIIKNIQKDYGITFSGKWKQKDKLAALTGVIVVAGALSKLSGLSAADTFTGAFGNLTFSLTTGSGNKWSGQRSTNPSGVSFVSGNAGLDPRLVAHELAHVFNAMYVNGGHSNSPYSALGGATITDSAGKWVTGLTYDSAEKVTKWTRGYRGYQTAPSGLYDDPALYHGPVDWDDANSVGEEYADMFMNWAFNSFAPTSSGAARHNWMSAEVGRALSVMLP
jgi:RHS repeat-associated protein